MTTVLWCLLGLGLGLGFLLGALFLKAQTGRRSSLARDVTAPENKVSDTSAAPTRTFGDKWEENLLVRASRFLPELGTMLSFMTEEDRQTALTMYKQLFQEAQEADDLELLMQLLVSPARQAVNLARTYGGKRRGGQEDTPKGEDQKPDFVWMIEAIGQRYAEQKADLPKIDSESDGDYRPCNQFSLLPDDARPSISDIEFVHLQFEYPPSWIEEDDSHDAAGKEDPPPAAPGGSLGGPADVEWSSGRTGSGSGEGCGEGGDDGWSFGGFDAPAPARTPRVSDVQFSALFPKRFLKGEYTILELYVFTEEERRVLEKAIAEARDSLQENRSGRLKVSDGAQVSVRLESADPSVEIDGNDEPQTWNGGYLKFDFSVFLPDNYPKRQLMFKATVLFNGVPASRLRFTAACNTLREQKMQIQREDVLSAFVSYASQDRSRVMGIIQGMQRAREDLQLFFDVDSLRCGEDWQRALRAEIERRDIFYLCWSIAARKSEWVEREWRYALECKGLDAIEPIAIDPPSLCPPPAELQSKHFNDRTLYFIRD